KAPKHIPSTVNWLGILRQTTQNSFPGNCIGLAGHCLRPVYPNFIAAHPSWICEKQKGTNCKCGIQDIHSRSTENFFPDNHPENYRNGKHPKRNIDWNNKRHEHSSYQISFLYFVFFYDCENKLNRKTNSVGNKYQRQNLPSTQNKTIPSEEISQWIQS